MIRVLIIDNNDSFTYNLVEVLRQNNPCSVEVCILEDIEVDSLNQYNAFILSPGPGLPEERKQFNSIIAEIIRIRKPLLGVCLGHQAIATYFSGKIKQLDRIIHGESSEIETIDDGLFKALPNTIKVGRYHSWVVDKTSFPTQLKVTATTKDALIMAFRHESLNVRGVQFHPESILTPFGKEILSNWLTFCVGS